MLHSRPLLPFKDLKLDGACLLQNLNSTDMTAITELCQSQVLQRDPKNPLQGDYFEEEFSEMEIFYTIFNKNAFTSPLNKMVRRQKLTTIWATVSASAAAIVTTLHWAIVG